MKSRHSVEEGEILNKEYTSEAGEADEGLKIGDTLFQSRLILGTGKYKTLPLMQEALTASGTAMVTVAVRRVNLGQSQSEPNLLSYMPQGVRILPNTAGCYTAQEAVRTARLARELLDGEPLVKLEVIGDGRSLYPAMPETLEAAQELVQDGFQVMAYCTDDPVCCKRLAELGCVAIMPLAAPIGSGLGVCNPYSLRMILEEASVPVVVDAGVGTASDAAIAMELGCDGILMNTAVAEAKHPVRMAMAMEAAVRAGRWAFLAGRMPKRLYASASSPQEGILGD